MANILIVESDPIATTIMSAILSKVEHNVIAVVGTAVDAIQCATSQRPELVLIGIELADGNDGIEAASHIINKLEIPVIFLIKQDNFATLERVQRVNPAGFLNRPIREADVINTVTIVLNRHRQTAHKSEDTGTFSGRIELLGGIALVLEMVKVLQGRSILQFEDGATLYLSEGKITHAEFENLPPEVAAQQLLTRNQGMFRLSPDTNANRNNSLSLDITTTLLTLAKEADEARKDTLLQDDLAAPDFDKQNLDEQKTSSESNLKFDTSLANTRPKDEARLAGFPFVGEVQLTRDMGKPLLVGEGVIHLPDKRYLNEFKATLLPIDYQGYMDTGQSRHYIGATVRIINMTEGNEPLTLECQFSSTGLEVEVSDV